MVVGAGQSEPHKLSSMHMWGQLISQSFFDHVHLLLVILHNITGQKQKRKKASSKTQQEYIISCSHIITSNILMNDSGNAWKDTEFLRCEAYRDIQKKVDFIWLF